MNFFAKARKRGMNAGNVTSWLSLQAMTHIGRIWGTMRLYAKARLLGIRLGKNVSAHGAVGLMRWPGSEILIGDDVSLVSSWRRSTACALAHPVRLRAFGPGAVINIGQGCQLNGSSITARSTQITLGRNVMLGPNCIIVDSDFHAHWPAEKRGFLPGYEYDAPVSIDDYVWLGMNVIVLKGVHIGKGAIIGAGSVVRSDMPENCVASGNPCKVLRFHNSD